MVDFIELAKMRQSTREFTEQPVEREKLSKLVEAARLAPSACNAQPWQFIVVTDTDRVRSIALGMQGAGFNQNMMTAQAFIVVAEQPARLKKSIGAIVDGQYFAKGDLGAATVFLTLEAATQGLGSCIIGVYDRESIRAMLNLSPLVNIAAVVAVGYPKDGTIREKVRKPLQEICRFE